MNRYPLWKHLLIAIVLVVGVFYFLPNLFGEDPALQISPSRNAVVDLSTQNSVEGALARAGVQAKGIELSEGQLLVRFTDPDAQLKAQDAVKLALGSDYIVALNLAPSTPGWLQALDAQPMYLGLDLRGGVHFLMEVDMEAAVKQAEERYIGDLRTLLRTERIRYLSITQGSAGIRVQFRDAQPHPRRRARHTPRQ